jgi:hypothetical protein
MNPGQTEVGMRPPKLCRGADPKGSGLYLFNFFRYAQTHRLTELAVPTWRLQFTNRDSSRARNDKARKPVVGHSKFYPCSSARSAVKMGIFRLFTAEGAESAENDPKTFSFPIPAIFAISAVKKIGIGRPFLAPISVNERFINPGLNRYQRPNAKSD